MGDFPFDIIQVATLMRMDMEKKRNRTTDYSIYGKCPFCNDPKHHCNLDLIKNAWRCNRCGESGGMIDLYGRANGMDNKEAYKAIKEGLEIEGSKIPKKSVPKKELKESEVRSDLDIHSVYTEMLNLPEFKITEKHYENLRNRGFRDELIQAFGYKSMPLCTKTNQTGIPKKLEDMGFELLGIPGFYKEGGKTKIVLDHSGFVIPVRNGNGKIVQAQIRRDSGDPKYVYLSSRYKENGTRTLIRVHTSGNLKSRPKKVYLTEGPLKADISSTLLGVPFLALQGVNSQAHLPVALETLKNIGVETIVEAFDMDKYTNPNVQKAVGKISEMIKSYGFTLKHATWDATFKGIDDMLYQDMISKSCSV